MATAEKTLEGDLVQAQDQNPKPEIEQPYPAARYAWYVVGVLTLIYVFSFIDRQILNLLVAPIRRDLAISDTQMSLLMGFSFAVFYTFFGIILGRMADTGSRRLLIGVGLVVWSLMTAACGLANSFSALLVFRIGVGIGEASLGPAAYSMISDYFAPERRATAMSVYSMGIYLGSGIAYLLGGLVVAFASRQEAYVLPLIGDMRPWQLIFFLVGFPGIAVALLMFTVREPVRRGVKAKTSGERTMRQTWKYLGANKNTIFCHNLGIALLTMATYGTAAWLPTFFVRTHGWTAGQIGVSLGIVVIIFGTLGVALGGRIADKLASRGLKDANLRVALYSILLAIPFVIAYPLIADSKVAFAVYIPTAFLTSVPIGVAAAALQQIMPNEMRGQATALYFFVINFLGLGLGPTLIALMTDYAFKNDNSIYLSLSIVCGITLVLSAALLAFGLKPYRRSLQLMEERQASL